MKASVSVLAACGAALLACEGTGAGGTSRYLASTHENHECPGAFTPNSEVCWDKNEKDEGPISTDTQKSEELLSDVEGMDRCAQVSVMPPGTPGTLSVTFTTQVLGGTYTPRNCGAAWIEDGLGHYVRTLEVWAKERFQSITMWFPRSCQSDPNIRPPDVITSATLDKHQTHSKVWDGKDFRGAVAPDGMYTLWLQVTESEFVPEGPYMMIPFAKGTEAWDRTPTPIPGFAGIQLVYKPGEAPKTGAVQP